MKFTLGESPYPWEGRKLFCRLWRVARGRKRNKEVARVDMKNGVYGGCKDYNTLYIWRVFILFPFFFAFLRSFRSLFLFSLSSRFLRGNGLDVLVSYKVKINFLIQRLIESSRWVSHIGASGVRSLFFFPSDSILETDRPALSSSSIQTNKGEKRKIIIDSLCALAVVSWQSASAGIYMYIYIFLVREIRAISLFFIRLLWSAARWHRMKRQFGHGRFTIEFADRYPRVK